MYVATIELPLLSCIGTNKHTHTHTHANAHTHARMHARTHARTHTHTPPYCFHQHDSIAPVVLGHSHRGHPPYSHCCSAQSASYSCAYSVPHSGRLRGREGGGIGGTSEEGGGDFNLYYSTMHECLLPMYIYRAMALHCTVTCSPLVESHWACGTGLLVDHTNMADMGLTTPEKEALFVSCSASMMGSGATHDVSCR